jgi:hypothetical protein
MNARSVPVNQHMTPRTATLAETPLAWAARCGAEGDHRCYQWLLHESIVWVRNPHYLGAARTRVENLSFVDEDADEAPLVECEVEAV